MIKIKLITFGDSTTYGFNGSDKVANPWPSLLAKQLNIEVDNPAINGSIISGGGKGTLADQVEHTDLSGATAITIMIGINDLNWVNNPLDSVMQELRNQIQKITLANPTAQILGLLPLPSWFKGMPAGLGSAGYSEQDLWRAETDVYASYGIPVYQWDLVTDKNHKQLFGDQVVHPTQATYQLMAGKLAQFIRPFLKERTLNDVVKRHRFVGLPFDEIKWPSPTYSRLAVSDNGMDWLTLKEYDFGWRDADIRPYKGWWYILRTGSNERTKDWVNFEELGDPLEADGHYAWAPEFFTTLNDEGGEDWHVIYSHDIKGEAQYFKTMVADFDPETGQFSNIGQTVDLDVRDGNTIDANLSFRDNKWWLWVSTDHRLRLLTADDYLGPFEEVDTNYPQVEGTYDCEAPEMFQVGNQMWLWGDRFATVRGMTLSRADPKELSKWHGFELTRGSFPLRHFRPYLNPTTTINMVNLEQLQNGYETNMNLSENFLRITTFVETLNRLMKANYMVLGNYDALPTGAAKTMLGRGTYHLINQGFRILQANLNELASCLRRNELADEDGNFLVAPQLDMPTGLLINKHFVNKVNKNWSSIEKMLNQINPILKDSGL